MVIQEQVVCLMICVKYMSIYNAPDLFGLPPRTPFGDERVLAMDPDYIFIPSYKGMDKNLASRYLIIQPFKICQL